VVLYGIAAVRYAELFRQRRRPLPLAVLVAFILMAEAMIAVAFARSWHATWWEWHALMAVAFGAILVAARVEYRREGALSAVFSGLYLDSTLRRIDRHEAQRLSEVVEALRSAPQLAASLERQPERARLGGEERQVSVLFADLAGFTAFSEDRPASEVVQMLNRYWAAACRPWSGRAGSSTGSPGTRSSWSSTRSPTNPTIRCVPRGRPWRSARSPRTWPPSTRAGPVPGRGEHRAGGGRQRRRR